MYTFLKTVLALAVMVSIIPLAVWGGSGSWRAGLRALKEYLLVAACFFVPVLAVTAISFIPRLF